MKGHGQGRYIVSLVVLTLLIGWVSGALIDGHMKYDEIESYDYHPCTRPCEDDKPPMVCDYDFLIEHYHTLTRACYDCPMVKEDCYSPHCVHADGHSRGIITVNRRMPGPPIHVCENDTIRARIHNKMEMGEGTTIHWHGVLQKGSPYMDGVAMVSQCAIPAHTSFTYTFVAATPGTHFWHAHSGLQRADGIFGQLVIRQPPSKEMHHALYDVDAPEHTMLINDWAERGVAPSFAMYHHFDHSLDRPHTLLFNGKGKSRVFYDERTGINVTAPREVFIVRHGVRYRFRVAGNNIQNCPIRLSIDHHMVKIIASDGHPLEPADFESFIVYGGERFDFVLMANQSIDNYLIRATGLDHCVGLKQTAILRYVGAPEDHSLDTPFPELLGKELNPYNTKQSDRHIQVTDLRSMEENDPALTQQVNKRFTLGVDFSYLNYGRLHNERYYSLQQIQREHRRIYTPQMNHISMIMPASPPMSQYDDVPQDIYCNKESLKDKDCVGQSCECLHTLKVDLYDVVEIILVDEGQPRDVSHSFHLHGHTFRVISMDKLGRSTFASIVDELDAAGNITRNLDRAPIKDSVIVPDGGYTIFRFYADNPGFWLFHCHIAYHTEMGMSLLFQVGEKKDFPPAPSNFPQCGSWHGEVSSAAEPKVDENKKDEKNGKTPNTRQRSDSKFTERSSYGENAGITVLSNMFVLVLAVVLSSVFRVASL